MALKRRIFRIVSQDHVVDASAAETDLEGLQVVTSGGQSHEKSHGCQAEDTD
jgi:hypothetical protein